MSVSPGGALLWSAALHTLGFGLAGWATHGRHWEPPSTVALHTTRFYALQYLTPARPKPRPDPTPARTPPRPRAPSPSPRGAAHPGAGTAPADPPVAEREPPPASLLVQELAPGAVAGIGHADPQSRLDAPAARRGLDRGAALVKGAGSACPELPLPSGWGHRQLAVVVAVPVDSQGRVDPSGVLVVESPDRTPSAREYYPRIYVVGARLKKYRGRMEAADYDAMVTGTVTRHVAGLAFRPAVRDGRPVSSTVLIACQRPSGH